MPTGVSSAHYPDQANPLYPIELENSYFLVRLHEAQAFFEAGPLVRPGYLILSSIVESTFQPGKTMQSLHKVSTMQKNAPCQLGIGMNLTDWLPARASDSLRIGLQYAVVHDSPISDLMDQMSRLGLIAQITIARPDLKAAIKISEIVGKLLSISLKEGSSQEIFKLDIDMDLANMKAGYYASVGCKKEADWPDKLRFLGDGQNASLMTNKKGNLDKCSYAIFQVLALKRRGQEIARGETWWELLQLGKDRALDAHQRDKLERRKIMEDWRMTLSLVKPLAIRDRGFLLGEVNDIIRTAQIEVQEALASQEGDEAYGDEDLPEAWQDILDVSTMEELFSSVRDYQESLGLSQRLMERYENMEYL